MNRTIKFFVLFLISVITFSCETTAQRLEKQERERVIERAEKEREIGKSAFAKIAGKYGVVRDDAATAYLNKLGKSLAMYTERQEIEYFFAILDTDQVNAFALPGGFILITRGAIDAAPDMPTLIGIISHELGHINLKHILKHIRIETKPNFFEILARFIAGPRNVVTNLVSQITDKVEEQLFIQGLDAGDEFEADEYSVKLMQSLNISASNYMRYIASMHDAIAADALQSMDKTHPDINARVEHMAKVFDKTIPLLKNSEGFDEFKAQVKSFADKKSENTEAESN